MKTSVIVISLILIAAVVWLIFFSGLGLFMQQEQNNQSSGDVAVIDTNYGTIEIQLARDEAPETTTNFEKLINEGFYDGLTFHRIISGFVIQGGDPEGTGNGGPGYTLPAEINLPHTRGAVATARLPDQFNPERESSGSQFYIALTELPQLDGQYTVFGNVISGMDVVDAIAAVETDDEDRPTTPVIIEKAYMK